MKTEYLNILSNQFCTSWAISSGNKYADPRLQEFHDFLTQCDAYLRGINYITGTDAVLESYECRLLDKFCRWINVLNANVSNSPHDEIKKCFTIVINEWLGSAVSNNYILCFSEGDYAYRLPFATLTVEQSLIKRFFHSDVKYQLVDIMMPTHLIDDIMYNVVLFHEVGHFIIRYYSYHDKVYYKLKSEVFADDAKTKILLAQSFPYLVKTGYDEAKDKDKMVAHIEEYIADLFGAQYVGNYIISNVEILGNQNYDKEDSEHPCFNMRKNIVDDFVSSKTDNLLLNVIKDVFSKEKHGELEIRYEDLDKSYYSKDVVYPIANNKQLLSLFKHSWDIYCDFTSKISPATPGVPMVNVFTKLTKWCKDSINAFI